MVTPYGCTHLSLPQYGGGGVSGGVVVVVAVIVVMSVVAVAVINGENSLIKVHTPPSPRMNPRPK